MQSTQVEPSGGRLSLADEQQQALRDDVAGVLARRAQINQWTDATYDQTRVLGIVAAASGAEQFLPYTIPTMIRQITEAGKRADLVIGLNNGYECPATIAALAELPDVETIHLYTGDKPDAAVPAPVFATAALDADYQIAQHSPHHRLFILHQRRGPYSGGKSRVLGDICHTLLDKIARGWIPPAYLLMFDSESLFVEDGDPGLRPELEIVLRLLQQANNIELVGHRLINEYDKTRDRRSQLPLIPAHVDMNARGLELLIAAQDSTGADLVSQGWRNCVHDLPGTALGQPVMLPNLQAEVSMLHRIGYVMNGLTPYTMMLSGGGTLGKTDVQLAIHATMYSTYPGLIGEDALATVLAHHAKFKIHIQRGVYQTNRCPAPHELVGSPPVRAWYEQYARWTAGNDAIEQLYGLDNITPIRGIDNRLSTIIAFAMFAQALDRTQDLPRSLDLLNQVNRSRDDLAEIKQLAKAKGYVFKGNYTAAAW